MDAGRPGQPRWLTCAVLAAAIAAPGLVLAQKDYLQRNPGGYTCHYLRSW